MIYTPGVSHFSEKKYKYVFFLKTSYLFHVNKIKYNFNILKFLVFILKKSI